MSEAYAGRNTPQSYQYTIDRLGAKVLVERIGKSLYRMDNGAYVTGIDEVDPKDVTLIKVGSVWYYPGPSKPVLHPPSMLQPLPIAPVLTGGSVDYYKVGIANPTTEGTAPYIAECNDIIEALGMDYAEGNAFKAIWRTAAARRGNGKPGNTALYDAEKVVFFGERMVKKAKNDPKR